jgi:hemerythrin-like domain-containing protein
MDAIKLLKDDHKKVKDLFRQFERARSDDRKKAIAEEVFHELEVHSTIEEEIFYPAFRAKADREGQEVVAESFEEHHVVDVLVQELKAMPRVNEQFEAKFTVLIENVEHHIEEEEKELLPDAEKALGDQLEMLGDRMQARREQLMAATRWRPRDQPTNRGRSPPPADSEARFGGPPARPAAARGRPLAGRDRSFWVTGRGIVSHRPARLPRPRLDRSGPRLDRGHGPGPHPGRRETT